MLDGRPYELLMGKFQKEMKDEFKGELVKVKRGHYQLWVDKELIIENVIGFISHDEDTITRLVSTNLRHGVSLEFITAQLEKTGGDLQSTYKIIARVLKKYIKDGTRATGEDCPNCKGQLIFQEGCRRCKDCSYSACG
jgi:ribonucleoside-diphosphate reductase alpha chain